MIECDVKCWCFNPYTMWALALQMEMGPHKDRGKLWPGWDLNPRPSSLITYSRYPRRPFCWCNYKGSTDPEFWSGWSRTHDLPRDSPMLNQLSNRCVVVVVSLICTAFCSPLLPDVTSPVILHAQSLKVMLGFQRLWPSVFSPSTFDLKKLLSSQQEVDSPPIVQQLTLQILLQAPAGSLKWHRQVGGI